MKTLEKLKQDLKTEITDRKRNEDEFMRNVEKATRDIEHEY